MCHSSGSHHGCRNKFSIPNKWKRLFHGHGKVAQACVKLAVHGVPSTTSVYGTQATLVDENARLMIEAASPYAESKLKAEDLLYQLAGNRAALCDCRFGTICGYQRACAFIRQWTSLLAGGHGLPWPYAYRASPKAPYFRLWTQSRRRSSSCKKTVRQQSV